MLNFGQKVEEKSSDIIPKDQLLWAVINVREIKNSRDTNGRYLDIELTIADGIPYARRKIWEMIADPFDPNNSEEWRTMGYGAIRRILEAVKGASPDNANSYVLNQLQDLHGLMVPIITKIEKAKADSGYDDKNKAEFLSPHSSVKKIVECFGLLRSGVYEYAKKDAKAAPGTGGSLFAGTGNPPPVGAPAAPASNFTPPAAANNAPTFLAPLPPAAATPAAPAANSGFSSGAAPMPQQNTGHAAPAANQAPAPATTAPTSAPVAGTSPSNFTPPAAFPPQH